MKKNDCVLGIDVGTSGCKILAMNTQGKILASTVQTYPCSAPYPGWSEQNPEDWWNGVVDGIHAIMPKIKEHSVCGIGLSAQMHGMVVLNKDGKVIRPAILWNDQRTEKQCEEITKAAGGQKVLSAITNNSMLTGYTGGKILWLKENEPENYKNTKVILMPKDYIRFKLSKVIATDVSDASGTGLYDVRNKEWALGVINACGLDEKMFPSVLESTEISGKICEKAAEETGLPCGIPVVAGGGDAVVSAIGMGTSGAGRAGIMLGTSGVVALQTSGFVTNPEGRFQVFCGNNPGTYTALGVTLNAAGAYHWLLQALGGEEKTEAEKTGKSAFYLLDKQAEKVSAGADGMLFLPYLTGERAPVNDPAATGAFLGVTLAHKKSHFIRAVLEGVAFSLKHVYDRMSDMDKNKKTTELILAGGGAVSPLWRQIFADVFQMPVHTVYGSAEGSAFGAALIAGVAVGFWKDFEQVADIIEVESTTVPNKENESVYRCAYEKYIRMYPSLKWSYRE